MKNATTAMTIEMRKTMTKSFENEG
jgi:hypothetical protein